MKITAAIVGFLLSVTMLGGPAAADPGFPELPNGSRPGVTPTSKCVTKSEYYTLRLHKTTRAEVERILDWEGYSASKRPGVNTWNLRRYRGCDGHQTASGKWRTSNVFIWYGPRNRISDSTWIVADWVPNS